MPKIRKINETVCSTIQGTKMNINIHLTEKNIQLLEKFSQATGRSIEELINNNITPYLRSLEIEQQRNITLPKPIKQANNTSDDIPKAKLPAVKPNKKRSFFRSISDFFKEA